MLMLLSNILESIVNLFLRFPGHCLVGYSWGPGADFGLREAGEGQECLHGLIYSARFLSGEQHS